MKIELLGLTQTVLLVPENTGIIYTNQVGGTECDHPEMEGFLIPIEYDIQLDNPISSLTFKLCALFPEGNPGIVDRDIAIKIQELLDSSPFTTGVIVDLDKIEESKEAWLYVQVHGTLDDTIEEHSVSGAVLTWPNSD